MKKYLWGFAYGIFLTAFTVYVLLDTFVITRVYSRAETIDNYSYINENRNNADGSNNSGGSGNNSSADNSENNSGNSNNSNNNGSNDSNGNNDNDANITVSDSNSYRDNNISINVAEYRRNDTSVYVADVKISSPEYLKTAFAQGSFGKNVTQKTSEISADNGAIIAINGDYYGMQEKGYVLRNGSLYRKTAVKDNEDLVIYKNGSFSIINENEISAEELLADNAMHILSFGPALVTNGAVSVSVGEEVGKAMTSNPRTAIGIIDDLHYIFVVSDGRTSSSEGLTLYQLAEFMQSLGAVTAYNLDGGGSSTMYFNGRVVNNPTTNGKSIAERSVSDIVYIGY